MLVKALKDFLIFKITTKLLLSKYPMDIDVSENAFYKGAVWYFVVGLVEKFSI